jgi:NB-ARC domain
MSTPKRQRPTLRLSVAGRTQVEEARLDKGWNQSDPCWLRAATKLVRPEPFNGWEAFFRDNPDNFSPSSSTLKNKFLKQQNIRHEFFVALCRAVGVRWEEVADRDNLTAGQPPQPGSFFGRNTVLRQLEQWVLDQEKCRLVFLHGRAGIGKTAIAYQLVQQIQKLRQNDIAPVWLSLENAMPLPELINTIIWELSAGQVQQGDLSILMGYLQQAQHLIVIDQWETILENINKYRSGYENYQDLLDCISKNHQSCVLIISREKLQYLTLMNKANRSLEVTGLTYEEDYGFLQAEKLMGTETELRKFIEIYHNPLILRLIADRVRTVHGGSVAPLVTKDASIYSNTDTVKIIAAEFKQLGSLEQSIVYWLAIWRNPISYEQLKFSFDENFRMSLVDESLYLLINQRSLVKVNPQSEYYLEPVTLKEITNIFVMNVVKELTSLIEYGKEQSIKLTAEHLFVIGDDEDINNEQIRRIVQLIIEQLLKKFESEKLQQKLKYLEYLPHGYASNNIEIIFQNT